MTPANLPSSHAAAFIPSMMYDFSHLEGDATVITSSFAAAAAAGAGWVVYAVKYAHLPVGCLVAFISSFCQFPFLPASSSSLRLR